MAKAQGKKKNSAMIWILVLAGILTVAFGWVFFGNRQKLEEVFIEAAKTRDILASVTESGTVEPVVEVKIASDVSGEVVTLSTSEGKEVKRGDLLVSIKPDNYQSALELAKASLNAAVATQLQSAAAVEQAKTQLMQDSATFKRQDGLFANKVISKAEWENALLKYNIAKSQLRSAEASLKAAAFNVESRKASLKTASTDLQKTNIIATMDGIVTRQNIRLGEKVVGTAQMEGTELFRIADLSRMQVVVKINENDIVHVHVGDSAAVEVDAYGTERFWGKVTEIAYSAASSTTGTDQITSFEVKVEISPASYQNKAELMKGLQANQSPFRPGMSAQVEIFTERVNDAVSVPIQSVTVRKLETDPEDADPREVVFVLKDGNSTALLPVETGISDNKYIQIKSGLKPGDQVITGPYRLLSKEMEAEMKVKPAKEGEKEKSSKEKEK